MFVPILDEEDARALYKNALNANDAELGFSTMPFAFVSNDVHAMELRAAINAPSGVQRASGVREQIELIVPQRELMFLCARQEDFERSFRLSREAPGWTTGPHNTSRWDDGYGTDPPTRSRAHLGPRDTMPAWDPLIDGPVYTFASREEEEQGYAQPWAHRLPETGFWAGARRALRPRVARAGGPLPPRRHDPARDRPRHGQLEQRLRPPAAARFPRPGCSRAPSRPARSSSTSADPTWTPTASRSSSTATTSCCGSSTGPATTPTPPSRSAASCATSCPATGRGCRSTPGSTSTSTSAATGPTRCRCWSTGASGRARRA